MSAARLLNEAYAAGLTVLVNGDALRVASSSGPISPLLRARLVAHKREILALLRVEAEDGGEAELRAWTARYVATMGRAYGYPEEQVDLALGILAKARPRLPYRVGGRVIAVEVLPDVVVRVCREPQPWARAPHEGCADTFDSRPPDGRANVPPYAARIAAAVDRRTPSCA